MTITEEIEKQYVDSEATVGVKICSGDHTIEKSTVDEKDIQVGSTNLAGKQFKELTDQLE